MPGQYFLIPSINRAKRSGSEVGVPLSLRTWQCASVAPASNASCVDSICSATVMGTAGLSFLLGSDPVMATVITQGSDMSPPGWCSISDVEKDRLVRSLHMNVEAVDDAGRRLLPPRDQRVTPLYGHGREDRVLGVGRRLVGKVKSRVGVQQQAAHEHDDVDVWRLDAVDRAGLYGLQHEPV